MGHAYAAGLAEAVEGQGDERLLMAIETHLRSNCYPPLPSAYAQPILQAIAAYEDEEPEAEISLVEFIKANTGVPVPRRARLDDDAKVVVSAADLIEATHTWAFVTNMDDDLAWDNQGVGDPDDEDDD